MRQETVSVRLDDPAMGLSRAQMLRRCSAAVGVICVGGVSFAGLASRAVSAGSFTGDARILNFALTLEHLQAAYYAQATDSPALDADVRAFAATAASHELEHIGLLVEMLGGAAQPPPAFDFGDTTAEQTSFLKVAVALEDLGVDAYNGQAANLSRAALARTARIVSVDARHAAWIRSLAGQVPAPAAVDPGRTATAVMADIARTGFVQEKG